MKTAYFLIALFLVGAFSISNAQSLKTAEEYNNRGLEKQGRGDIDGAIADYTSAVSLKAKAGTLATAYNNRANARMSKNDFDGAIADYSKAIELQPADEENYYNRGVALMAKGDAVAGGESASFEQRIFHAGDLLLHCFK